MKVTHLISDMQKQWQIFEQRANSLIALATHGTDVDLAKELSTIPIEQLKSIVIYINKDGNTLLHVTAVKERAESLMALVKLSVDINAKNGNGRSALLKCINHNTLSSARLLLQAGANVNEVICRQTSETLLHHTVKSNRLKAMELLLDMGADTDVKTCDGETPLHFAARYNRLMTAQILLQAGADVNATNKNGETALHVSIATKSFDLAKLLIQHKHSNMALKDRRGMTPLHTAVADGCIDLVRIMLSSNSTAINSKESLLGRTPLLLACSNGTQKMASLLLSHGADANLTTNYRKSVLHVAASNGNAGVLGAVIKFSTNPNALSINNMTPLHYAVKGRYSETVKILLKYGVNAIMKDIEGHTPLHMASSTGDNESLIILLQHKVQVNATNMKQQTPLHLALMNGHKDTGSILIANGTDPSLLDVHDKTAMDYWEEYQRHARFDSKTRQRNEIEKFLFPEIAEEEDKSTAPPTRDEDRIMNIENKDTNGNLLYDSTDSINSNNADDSQNGLLINIHQNGNGAERNANTADYSVLIGDVCPIDFMERNHIKSEILDEHEDIIFLQSQIGEMYIVEENGHEDEQAELQIEQTTESELTVKQKKQHSNHHRVRRSIKSKKLPTMTKSSKNKSKINKSLNVDPLKHSPDCQHKRKTVTAKHN